MSAAHARDGFTVLVNSCDAFEDCWDPFFTLYRRHWPQADAPVLLNTETRDWRHGAVDLRCSRVQQGRQQRLTWSECLIAALDQVQTSLVLYMQEDYFLDRPVFDDRVRAAAAYMHAHPEVGQIGLTGIGSAGPYLDHPEPWLQSVRQKARYRISTQAALWRVETLRSYLEPVENGWMFEIFGTWRAHRRHDQILVVREHAARGGWPMHYLHTGIVKGKWLPGIEKVFADNGISVDFSRRGFYQHKSTLARRWETARMLLRHPLYALRQFL
ncbi:MAG: hypothetical protein WAQ05_17285 [Rubrivivax sp.]